MTKITKNKLMRTFEDGGVRREHRIEVAPSKLVLDCDGTKFEIFVSVGQFINRKKMCKRLLANKKIDYGKRM